MRLKQRTTLRMRSLDGPYTIDGPTARRFGCRACFWFGVALGIVLGVVAIFLGALIQEVML